MEMRWKTWLGMAALFLGGVLVGAAGTGLYAKKSVEHFLFRDRPAMTKLIMGKLTRELQLDEKQRVNIEKIVCETEREVFEIRKRVHPEIEEVISKDLERIKPYLTTAQQQKLDALHEKARAHWAHDRKWLKDGAGGQDCGRPGS